MVNENKDAILTPYCCHRQTTNKMEMNKNIMLTTWNHNQEAE